MTAYLRQPKFIAGSALLCLVFMLALTAPQVSRYDPAAQVDPEVNRLQAPSRSHLFGTDQFGRDVFSRTLYGGRVSLMIALVVVAIAASIGTVYGMISGYIGGAWDAVLMRLVDLFLAFPLIFMVATCIALFGNDLFWLILVLALTGWMDIARLVRAEILSRKNQPFLVRVRATGMPRWRIFLRHLIPNVLEVITPAAVLRAADIILIESALSFLGLGVQPPAASWGAILQDGRTHLATAWWLSVFPGVAIILATLGLYLVGEGLKPGRA